MGSFIRGLLYGVFYKRSFIWGLLRIWGLL